MTYETVGSPFVVNQGGDAHASGAPQIIELSSGNFLTVWRSASLHEYRAQLFDARGARIGGEFAFDPGGSYAPDIHNVVATPDGGFAMVRFTTVAGNNNDNHAYFYLQRFDSNGNPKGSETLVNDFDYAVARGVSIAIGADGSLAVSYSIQNISNELYYEFLTFEHPDGTDSGSYYGDNMDDDGLIGLSNGNYIMVSHVGGHDFLKTLDAAGAVLSSQQLDNGNDAGFPSYTQIKKLADGNYVAVWLNYSSFKGYVNTNGIHAQILDADGNKIGDEILIRSTDPALEAPGVTALASGGFMVSWTSLDKQYSNPQSMAQQFDDSGKAIGSVFPLSSGLSEGAVLQGLTTGGYMATWLDATQGGQSIDAQIYHLAKSGTAGADMLTGTGLDEILHGLSGNDIIMGDGGHDVIDGGSGTDTVSYALSTSKVTVNLGVTTMQNVSEQESDQLISIENVIGSAFDDELTGNTGNNVLDGGASADIMSGGSGDDTYYVDNIGDNVIESSATGGTDIVYSSVSYSLAGRYVETLTLTGSGNINATGNGQANTLNGNAGNNVLDGGAGVDVLSGGAGNDTYYVDNVGDNVIESSATGGTDIVYSSVSYSLAGRYVETLTLTGSGNINATGNGQANTLNGNAGNNVLDGGAGADILSGGAGNDTYYVDNTGDNVVESSAAGGTDIIYSSVSYGLSGRYVETLTLIGTGAINATGNGQANTLNGNAGNNVLDGGAGVDVLSGGAGNDTYYVDNIGDNVVESSATGGNDTVHSSVSYSLHGRYVETLALTGTAAIDAVGNDQANMLVGNGAANTLTGMGGADTFVFDTALKSSNIDTITDFAVGQDMIDLDRSIFTAAGSDGALSAGAFYAGTAAHDADDRIIYDAGTGNLFYDADGNGAGKAIQFATLSKGLSLTASSFTISG